MTQNVEDLRIRRTRKLLQKAMLEAAGEKGFAQVTVRDITKRAMVNRATFYRHYQDKYDLLTHYLKELSDLIDWKEEDTLIGSPPPGLVKLLQHMQANADFYRVMLGRQGDPAFCMQAFRAYIERGFRILLSGQDFQPDRTRPPVDLTVNYLMQAGMGAIVWWLESEQPASPEQMADWLYQFSMACIGVSLSPR